MKLSEVTSTENESDSSFFGTIERKNPDLYITNNTDFANCIVPDSLAILGMDSDAVEVIKTDKGLIKGWFDVDLGAK